MEEEVKGIADYLDVIRRRKFWVIIPALILIVASVAVAFLLPATYKSQGLILIESQEIPSDLVKSTVTSYADQRIEVIKQRIMTTQKVMALVDKYKLYPESRKQAPPAEIVAMFRENIQVTMVNADVKDPKSGKAKSASIAFKVSFMDRNPALAQKVASELVTQFLEENVLNRTGKAADTKDFLEEEANKFQRKIQVIEKKIAEFKDQYSDSLPELLPYNISSVERFQQELVDNQNQIMALQDQILTLNMELASIPAYLSNVPQTAQRVYQSEADKLAQELEKAEDMLSSLLQRYSVNHPDVKSAKNQIILLEEKVAKAQADEAKTGTATTSTGQSRGQLNPIYVQIKSKVDSSEREIIRLRNRKEATTEKLADYENRVLQTHQVQRAFEDLTRDHENNLIKYKELRSKQLEAELGQNLESENKGESFTLIEPPQLPNKAEKPNRPKVMAMGIIVSVGVGLGLAFLVEFIKGGVRGYKEMTRIIGQAPLVVVPIITTLKDESKKHSSRKYITIWAFILIIVLVVCFHFFVMDLEVLWYKIMRKVTLL